MFRAPCLPEKDATIPYQHTKIISSPKKTFTKNAYSTRTLCSFDEVQF